MGKTTALLLALLPLLARATVSDGEPPVVAHELCYFGIPSPNRTVCCAASCLSCGGSGCSRRNGGSRQCCPTAIANARRTCREPDDTGCVLPADVSLKSDVLKAKAEAWRHRPTVAPTAAPTNHKTVTGPPPPKRILVHCLQSAGCSLFTYLLAQIPRYVAVLDMWCGVNPGAIVKERIFEGVSAKTTIVLKAEVRSTDHKKGEKNAGAQLATLRRNFHPDVTILYLRHPVDNMASLESKPYGACQGTALEKLVSARPIEPRGPPESRPGCDQV